ncbi:hypothetical protein [Streptomyces qinglanensis]|uniref:Uncharacterized protein n=1 Tax=Streptomyces qinglanensis TaxID=943816 RepID=A0A1H9U4P0_9ACTN|nr:hypothetical protein [Streptomyces qinglanensis]SES04465.1 hypothetical protein SAMN05421870_107335 [Streptomyces qinglanensis]
MTPSSQNPEPAIGQYRKASRLQEGWYLKHEDQWKQISRVVQMLSPLRMAMLTLADGFEVSVPHTHEVFTRTAPEMKRAGGGVQR